jgi:hypothetical protein
MRRAGREPTPGGALFTPVQQRLLALLYGQPDRRYGTSELVRLVGSGTGAVIRHLRRLEQAELVVASQGRNHRSYRANTRAPVFQPLHDLVIGTVGVVEPLRRALRPFEASIRIALAYRAAPEWVDPTCDAVAVTIVGERLREDELENARRRAEQEMDRRVELVVLTPPEWRAQLGDLRSVASLVVTSPHLLVFGSEADILLRAPAGIPGI